MADKFFYALMGDAGVRVTGTPEVHLGHRSGSGGIFAEWRWDGESLLLRNDRYGFFPIYYGVRKGAIAVSSSIAKLVELGFGDEFDVDSFSLFLRLGWFVGDATAFRSIRAVPPNATLTWKNGDLNISSAGIIKARSKTVKRDDAVRTYGELFQRAVESSLPEDGKIVLPLSGGRDSRHILFALSAAGRPPDVCLTALHFPPKSNEDSRKAANLCAAVRVDHQIVKQPASRFDAERQKNLLTGFIADEHSWYMALVPHTPGSVCYDGIAGDVLSAGLFLNEQRLHQFEQQKLEELAEEIMGPEGYLPAFLTAKAYKTFCRERARNYLVDELHRHTDAPNPVGSFFFWNRTRRSISMSTFRLLGEGARLVMPFIDDDVFDYLTCIPARTFLDHSLHSETISATYPQFSYIPYEDKLAPPTSDIAHYRRFAREIFKYSLTNRKRELLSRSFFATRCARALLDSAFSRRVPEYGERSMLLLQLERL